MTKQRKHVILSLLCAALSVGMIGAGIGIERNAAAEATLTEVINFESTYALGTEFTIPVSSIEFDGVSYPAEAILRYPDGGAFSGEKATLDVKGKYVLEYRATTPKGVKSIEKEFVVSEALYSVGSKSTAGYGTAENASERPGIVTSLAYGDKLLFNQVIDLSENTKEETIATLFVNPIRQGLADALNVVFVLTDMYNAENYVTVTAKRLERDPLQAAWQELNTYVTVNAAGQAPTGLERSGSGAFSWEGGTYHLHRNDIYGMATKFSMAGIPNVNGDCSKIGEPTDIASQSLSLSMDYANRRVYVNDSIVADLDDVSMYPSLQWSGFSTGECLLSIYATSYNQDTFNFVLTEADGLRGEALAEDYIVDAQAPAVETVYGDYAETGFPEAVVGRTYPVPAVSVSDNMDKNVKVTTKVYRDYGQLSQVNVMLKDGAFIPTKEGTYTVIYTATDNAGNSTQHRFDVRANVCDAPLGIELAGGDGEGETGVLLRVASAEVSNPQGRSVVSVTARHLSSGVVTEIPTSGENAYAFRPLYAGEWEIKYVYADYMETKAESYTITVNKSAQPYIAKEVTLPKYVIKGATYALPVLYGYVFESGSPVEEKAEVYLQDDEKTERKISGSGFTSYAKEYTTVIYRLGSGESVAEKRYTIPVVDVGYDANELRIKDYFVGSAFTAEARNDRIALLTEQSGTQSFTFINALQVFDFRTVFHVSTAANKFKAINVYLEDSENSGITVKVTYTRNTAGNTLFTVNDGTTTYQSTGDFVESSVENFRLVYNNSTRKISPSTAYGVTVEKDLNGNDFGGFPSGKVYMKVELVGITGKAGVEFLNINNQPMSKVGYDLLRPEISTTPVVGERYLGDEVVIPATFASDVLDPDIDFIMYVQTPGGEYVTSKDGVLLDESADPTRDYTVLASEYGSYTIYYECTDTMNPKIIYSYVFTVVDTSAPEITLSGKVTEAKVGDTVIVAQASAKDDYTECNVMIKVKLPSGAILSIPGNSFVATVAGEYTVYYFAYDESFNLSTASYVVNVS